MAKVRKIKDELLVGIPKDIVIGMNIKKGDSVMIIPDPQHETIVLQLTRKIDLRK